MASKLSARQQAQLGWLDTVPMKLDRLNKIVETMGVGQADDAMIRTGVRMADQLKAQASSVGMVTMTEFFARMGATLRQSGSAPQRVKVLRELSAGARITMETFRRTASAAANKAEAEDEE